MSHHKIEVTSHSLKEAAKHVEACGGTEFAAWLMHEAKRKERMDLASKQIGSLVTSSTTMELRNLSAVDAGEEITKKIDKIKADANIPEYREIPKVGGMRNFADLAAAEEAEQFEHGRKRRADEAALAATIAKAAPLAGPAAYT